MIRFTIRDVLWLTTLCAVTLGMGGMWSRDHSRLANALSSTRDELRAQRGKPVEVWVGDANRMVRRGQKMLVEVEESGSVGFTPIFDQKTAAP